jgi:polyhydroxybutyrate depolymerase
MLIALHGGGGDDDFQADDSKYKLISKSEAAGFIAVFPNGYSRFPGGILATWNAGSCCGAAQKNNVDDVGFIREVIHRVERQASIDPKRVFAAGMSNGAMMSWRLACEAPEVRAIAPVEGTDNTATCKPPHPVAVIEFHAADDPNVAALELGRRTRTSPRSRRHKPSGSSSIAPTRMLGACSR